MSDQKTKPLSVIIIGAGVGGTASAARLAKAGCQVTVVEKNDFTGGRCSLLYDGEYRFDQGPSLLLLPDLFKETFDDLNTSMPAEDIHLKKCEPNYRVHFHDNEMITLTTDLAQMKKEVEKWEGKDGFERYLRWLTESHRHYELSVSFVLRRNFYSILSLLRLDLLFGLPAMHAFTPMYTRGSKYFYTDRLRRCFTFGSMYMGMSPFVAPAVYSLLQYTELAEGIWYPEGGFNKVVQGLVAIGKRTGVDYRLSSPVKKIALSDDQKRATGVILESGETLNADVVLVNADLIYSYNNLLPESPYAAKLLTKPASCSSISFYWSMDREIPELSAHNIFLAEHYQESFDDIFNRQTMPDEPSFYVNVPSRIDPTAAPAGKDAIVVLLPVGHIKEAKGDAGFDENHQDWPKLVETARQVVFDTIEKRTGVKGLRDMVVHEMINTPLTWKETFNLDRGSILGLSIDFWNALSFRPSTKHATVDNCYFVGASTHPGTGVPVCLAGAKVTTEQILTDKGIPFPWQKVLPSDHAARKSGSKLDIIKRIDTHGMQPSELLAWALFLAISIFLFFTIMAK